MTPASRVPSFSWRPFAWWFLGFALLGAPLVFSTGQSNLSGDESAYYLPAIRQIREHWPRLDLVGDSLSATGPGYAYALATVSFVTGASVPALRTLNWLVSLGVLAVLWAFLQRRGGRALTFALLPLAFSNFFVKSSGWIVTDNAALLLTTLALLPLLFVTPAPVGRASLFSALGVAVRQVGIWLLLPLAWRAVAARNSTPRRWKNLLWLALPLVPLACFALAWHGLVPPAWRAQQVAEGGLSATPIVYLLAVLFTLGLPFYLSVTSADDWRDAARQRWIWFVAVLALALVLSVSTLPDHAAGRWGGYWWSLAARLPRFGRVSLVFLLLAPPGAWLGGALARKLWRTVGPARASLLLATIGAWAATTLVNRMVFHRYFEPPLLVFLLCWLALVRSDETAGAPVLIRRWPLLALASGQLAITLLTVHAQAYGLLRFE